MIGNPNVDPEGVDVETCLQQLRDPAVILAEALYRVHRADAAQAEIEALSVPICDADVSAGQAVIARHEHLTRTADALAYIAKSAADMAAQGRQAQPMTDADAADMDLRAVPPNDLTREYEPQAVNGVRFDAKFTGYYMGAAGGNLWAFVAGFFVAVGAFTEGCPAVGDRHSFRTSGRVVSITPNQALCITDGGVAITLPRVLIVESADE